MSQRTNRKCSRSADFLKQDYVQNYSHHLNTQTPKWEVEFSPTILGLRHTALHQLILHMSPTLKVHIFYCKKADAANSLLGILSL
jgi:hypothetical protein